jgi:hypothetical protein
MASSYHCMGAAGCQGCFRPSPPPSGSLGGASGGSVSLGIMRAAKARGGVSWTRTWLSKWLMSRSGL